MSARQQAKRAKFAASRKRHTFNICLKSGDVIYYSTDLAEKITDEGKRIARELAERYAINGKMTPYYINTDALFNLPKEGGQL